MRLLIICAVVLLMGSCTTKQKAFNWLDKHPIDAARYCSVEFPTRVEYRKGETVVVRDTVVSVQDSVPCPPDSLGKVVRVPCPPSKVIYQVEKTTDTVLAVDYAELAEQRLLYFKEKELRLEAEAKLGVAEDKAKNRLWWIIGLGVFAALELAFIVRRIF